jgi:hypothetical protein
MEFSLLSIIYNVVHFMTVNYWMLLAHIALLATPAVDSTVEKKGQKKLKNKDGKIPILVLTVNRTFCWK